MSKKISARIGAGTLAVATVVAGLSFGPAAVANAAAPTPAITAGQSTQAAAITVVQNSTIALSAGRSADINVHIRNTGDGATGRGLVATFVAPSGTTFTSNAMRFRFGDATESTDVTGVLSADKKTLTYNRPTFGASAGTSGSPWTAGLTASLTADNPLRQGGVISDGSFTASGAGIDNQTTSAAITYTATKSDAAAFVSIAQTNTLALGAGAAGDVNYRISNTGPNAAGRGLTAVFRAPSGTTFSSNKLGFESTSNGAGVVTGVLSADRKTLTYTRPTFGFGDGTVSQPWTANLTAHLVADLPLRQNGVTADGSFTVSGAGMNDVTKTGAVTYTATKSDADAFVSGTQINSVALSAGDKADLHYRISNTGPAAAGRGAQVVFTAPSGTTFSSNELGFTIPNGSSVVAGTLSADGKTLTYNRPTFGIGDGTTANPWNADFVLHLVADKPLAQDGVIADGSAVASGAGLDGASKTTALRYTATKSTVAQPIVNPVAAGDNVLSGTGTPGSTVIVKDKNGDQVGSALVGADGKWTVTVPPTYGPGKHDFDVIATKDGQESTSTPVTVDFGVAVDALTPSMAAPVKETRPVFTGTGQPGATIVIAGTRAEVARATVGADGTWTATSTMDLPAGDYRVTATQTTSIGVRSVDTIDFQRKNDAPVATPVKLETPTTGSTVNTKRPTFTGTGFPGATVEIRGTRATVATTTVGADGKWSVTSPVDLPNGDYRLFAEQTPQNGAAKSIDETTIKVAYQASADIVVTGPTDTVATPVGLVTFTGKGEANATVTIEGTTAQVASGIVSADGTFSITSTVNFPQGDYRLVAKQVATNGELKQSASFLIKVRG